VRHADRASRKGSPARAFQRRRRLRFEALGGGLVLLGAIVLAIVTSGGPRSRPGGATATVATIPFAPASAAALSAASPPWLLPADARSDIAAAGLTAAASETTTVHYHAHLDVIAAGAAVPVPAGVGFVVRGGQAVGITALHTHDAGGVIHIESPTDRPYTLGQFFTEWGVRLGTGRLGSLRSGPTSVLRVFVDGHEFFGDPADIVLVSHQEIALWYGPAGATPRVPAHHAFPPGL